MRKNVQARGQQIYRHVYIDNINLNFLARTAPYPVLTSESRDSGGKDDVICNRAWRLDRSLASALAADRALPVRAG